MKKKISKPLYWTPRILSILFLCFLAMFSLDIFDEGYGFWGTVIGLFIHNIPVLMLAILLAIAWKKEIVGAYTFFIAGLLYLILVFMRPNFEWYRILWSLTIAVPAFLIGTLFLINWKRKK